MAKKKKKRSAAQKRATAKMLAANKRARSKKHKRKPASKAKKRKKPRSAAQKAATAKLVARNKRRARGPSAAQRKGYKRAAIKRAARPRRSKEAASEQTSAIMAALRGARLHHPDADTVSEQRSALAAALGVPKAAAKKLLNKFKRVRLGSNNRQLSLDMDTFLHDRSKRASLKGLLKAGSRLRFSKKKANPAWRPGRPKKSGGRAWYMCEVKYPKRKNPVIFIDLCSKSEALHNGQRLAKKHKSAAEVVVTGPYKHYPNPLGAGKKKRAA